MKIDSSHSLTRTQQADQTKQGDKASQATASAPASPAGQSQASVTRLSQAATDASQDIDLARVDEVRQAISEGRLEVRADKIADGLIASVNDLLEQDRS